MAFKAGFDVPRYRFIVYNEETGEGRESDDLIGTWLRVEPAGWDPTDLEKMPVSYETKDRGTTYDLAYHPVLPLVASPGSGAAVFFHRETGDLQRNRLKLPEGGLGDHLKVHRIYFSPDGKHLVFDTSINNIHYLQNVELRLTADELRRIRAGLENRGALPRAEEPVPAQKVPLRAFDSLKGGRGKGMSTKEIARWFTDSVVVIRTDEGSGTGFVVGRDGYIVTCEHVLPRRGEATVVYRKTAGGQATKRTTTAKIVLVSERKDLALLKIDPSGPLRSVRFDLAGTVETGERVSVIGNPGVGSRILDHTMTEGIVSNPRRELDSEVFIQTSASVNPGSSGGPMFNDHGLVIGLVVLKANIEALFGGVVEGKVRLRKTDGRIINLPLERLSRADQDFVRRVTRANE